MKSDATNKPDPQELREALNLNKLILESAGEGIYGLDAEGRTTFVNQAAEKMTGFSAKEMMGNCQHKLVHHSKLDGQDYPHKECPIYAALHDGKVHKVSNEVFWQRTEPPFPSNTSAPLFVKT